MAEMGLDYIKYDVDFRNETASQASEQVEPWGWNIFRQEKYDHLQLEAILQRLSILPKKWYADPPPPFDSSFQPPNNYGNQSNTQTSIPFGYCFDFHTSGRKCEKMTCSYRHVCPCGRGPHNMYACHTGGCPATRGKRGGYRGRGSGRGSNPSKE